MLPSREVDVALVAIAVPADECGVGSNPKQRVEVQAVAEARKDDHTKCGENHQWHLISILVIFPKTSPHSFTIPKINPRQL